MNAQEILDHHLAAIGEADVDEILKDYTEESIVYTPMGTMKGLDQIKALFTGFVSEYLPKGSTIDLKISEVEEDLAYIVFEASSEKYDFPVGSDTLIIKEGKIHRQTFAAHIIPK